MLVLALQDEPGRSFRVVADRLHLVENNLSLGNADFADLAAEVDADGVLRATGVPSPQAAMDAMRAALG
ncbi:hypothetical protein [Kitasatospora sp. NPDC097643]|uniref:DUF6924 domain-containing protein n=1 Tax=Kitasatospora sp. NPDC097643 TaxID=3157230 RepID=UPI00332EE6EB